MQTPSNALGTAAFALDHLDRHAQRVAGREVRHRSRPGQARDLLRLELLDDVHGEDSYGLDQRGATAGVVQPDQVVRASAIRATNGVARSARRAPRQWRRRCRRAARRDRGWLGCRRRGRADIPARPAESSCSSSALSAAPITPGSRRTAASSSTIAGQFAARQHVVADAQFLDRSVLPTRAGRCPRSGRTAGSPRSGGEPCVRPARGTAGRAGSGRTRRRSSANRCDGRVHHIRSQHPCRRRRRTGCRPRCNPTAQWRTPECDGVQRPALLQGTPGE